MATASRVEKELLKALQEFAEKLEQGVPIEATEVRRVKTPDGPMHIQKHVIIQTLPKPSD